MPAVDQVPNCPACDAKLMLRQMRPQTSTPREKPPWATRIRDYYALPVMQSRADLANSGLLDVWECHHCKFRWELINGSLDSAVGILMLGFTSSGKSTYIASLGLPAPASSFLTNSRSGATWGAFRDFYEQHRVLPQTRMSAPSNPIREILPSPEGTAPTEQSPGRGSADDLTVSPDPTPGPDLNPPPADSVVDEPPVAGRVAETEGETGYRVFALDVGFTEGRRAKEGTALLLDMPGEALAPEESLGVLLDQAGSLVKAPMVIFCLDPTQLEGLRRHRAKLGLEAHSDSGAWQVNDRLAQIANIRKRVFPGGVPHGHLAVVILKGDRLEELEDFPKGALAEFDMTSPSKTWDRLRADSDDVRTWLEDGIATGMVSIAKNMFGSVSYHVVTSTGCSPEVGHDGKKRYPQVTPRRVLDPITYYYLMRFRKFDG